MIKVNVRRGDQIESVHEVKVAVLDSSEKIIFSTKNNKDITYPRSAIKIFQSIPLILSGAAEFYNLTDKLL